jgi:hypothetical protein
VHARIPICARAFLLSLLPQEPFFQLHTYNNSGGCTIQIRAASDAFVSFDAPQPRTCVTEEAGACG